MTHYGASSRHHDHDLDSASDTGRDYQPRNSSGAPPRTFGRPARGHPGSTLGRRAAHTNPYSSDDEGEFERGHHHHHHGHVRGADPYGSDDDSEFEGRGHGHGHAGTAGMTRDGPRIVNRGNGTARSGPRSGAVYSSDDESECEHHVALRGGRHGRSGMRFDTDSDDDISHGPAGGRRSTAPRGGRVPPARIGSDDDEAMLERHMAAARRGRAAAGARGGMMAPERNGRASGGSRGAVGGRRA